MLLINYGIQRVVCERKYQLAEESEQLLAEASIKLVYKYDIQQEYYVYQWLIVACLWENTHKPWLLYHKVAISAVKRLPVSLIGELIPF